MPALTTTPDRLLQLDRVDDVEVVAAAARALKATLVIFAVGSIYFRPTERTFADII